MLSHGGPTSQATPTFNPSIQFWTSRGFAVVDVNYGGSSGYGRDYRRRLNGNWGVVDPWVGLGFGLERLIMAREGYPNIERVGRSLAYVDGVRLNV